MDVPIEQTAYHEAGHAIGHICIGKPFTNMSIVSTEDYLGAVNWNSWTEFDPEVKTDARTIRRMKQWIVIFFAGPKAESLYTKSDPDPIGSEEDFHEAVNMAHYSGGSSGDVEDAINCAYKKTEKLLQSNWSAVERLAQELLEKKTLTYRAAKKIVEPFLTILPKSFVDLLFEDEEQ